MNTLTEYPDNLAEMHHGVLLDAVTAALTRHALFTWDADGRLLINADGIAREVMRQLKDVTADMLVTRPRRASPTICTLHMPSPERDRMREQLRTIQTQLHTQFAALARDHKLTAEALAHQHLGTALTTSPFGTWDTTAPQELRQAGRKAQRKRLTFTRPAEGSRDPLMRWHKLTLTVEVAADLAERIAAAIRTRLHEASRLTGADRTLLETLLVEQVHDPDSEIARLVTILVSETVGQLKKQAALHYLAFLEGQLDSTDAGRRHLHELRRRLGHLQVYLRDPNRADTEYEIPYQGATYNLRALFAPGNADIHS